MNRLRPQILNGLQWVRGELDQSLDRARSLIEAHADNPSDPLPLQQAFVELHQVRGTASMIQCFGLAVATEEMKQTVHELMHGKVADADTTYSTLLGASVQLSDYIDAIATGADDCVLVLQPLINELRLSSGKNVLTESDLFVSQLRALNLVLPAQVEDPNRMDGAVQVVAQKLLPVYQTSLLHWLKHDADALSAVGRMGKIAEQLAINARGTQIHLLWRTCAAVVEALLTRTLEDSIELKRLFGAAGQQIKLLAESGEEAAVSGLADLPYQLLFFVGRSRGQGPRVSALRRAFLLDTYLPPVSHLEEVRRKIKGANTTLMARVSQEVSADLSRVKDTLDLLQRGGARAVVDLPDTQVRLKRVADTLSMLGLPVLHRVVANQIRSFETLVPDQAPAPELLMDVATALLRVESSLEGALFRSLSRDPASEAVVASELQDDIPHTRDLKDSQQALLRESLVSLARMKSAVDAYIKTSDTASLVEGARMLDEVAAALGILQIGRAEVLIGQLARYVKSPAFARLAGAGESSAMHAEVFADAVACIEYFIEAQKEGVTDAQRMLDDLARFVEKIDFSEQVVAADEAPANVVSTEEVVEPVQPPAPEPVAQIADEVDTEIRDIFLEESAEVIQTLAGVLPRWSRDVHDIESLTVIRRGFHTLKGSGRMVGASEIAEFAWSLENMLNRCLNGTIPMGAEVVELTQKSIALLPQLVDSFRSPAGEIPQKAELQSRADVISSGTDLSETEPSLLSIFREDARERLSEINAWLENPEREGQNVLVPQDVVRAYHTLRGAAATVGLEAPSQLAGMLENALKELQIPESSLAAVAEITAQINLWSQAETVPAMDTPEVRHWTARAEALGSDADRLQAPDSDNELAEVFAGEAFDLVQKLEENAAGWALSPASSQAPQTLKVTAHTLLGAALMSDCPSLAAPSRALVQRMDAALLDAAVPDAVYFARLAEIFEQMYQFLDAYREGRVVHDGTVLAATILALPWNTAPEIAQPQAVLPVEPTVTDSVDAIDMAVVAEAGDDELTQIFLSEARDLLESLDAHSAAWEQSPGDLGPAHEIQRVLHTFKGGARMAGQMGLGDVAHRLESLLEHTLRLPSVDPAWFACLHQVSDGLHGALGGVARGQWSDTAALLAEMDSYDQSLSSAAVQPEVMPEPEQVPVSEGVEFEPIPMDVPEAPPQEAPAVARASPPVVAAESISSTVSSDQDFELAQIFSSEAAELLEQLERTLDLWREQPQDLTPVRGIQHILHTLKGGARMAGLNAMGTSAHEMEESVMRMEQGAEPVDIVTLGRLQSHVEDLQTMHDLLERGDLEPLQQERYAPRSVATVTATAAVSVPDGIPPVQAEVSPVVTDTPIAAPPTAMPVSPWDPLLFWKPDQEPGLQGTLRRETARVPVEQLDGMLNQAGEISIFRSRLEQQVTGLQTQLNEMAQAIQRLREQLRLMDIETEAQISARGLGQSSSEQHRYEAEFDPLEMDRFTRMQELSRSLSESVSDLSNLHVTMDDLADESETLLQQQGRINTQVQQGLMGTLMVPFSRQVARLQRVVKQTAQEIGKQAEAVFVGVESELDRNVLERMTAPLEHLLRNAVVHGLETPEIRRASGKPEMGKVTVSLWREGTQLLIELRDDGAGLNYKAIREQAIKRGLMPPDAQVEDAALAQFIFEAGFSTAKSLTQAAGRGIGMDVVASEVKQLGGSLELGSEAGKGTRFLVRLPLTLAISQALLTGVGTEQFAIPLPSIEGIARIPRDRLDEFYAEDGPSYAYGGQQYRVHYLGDFIGVPRDRDLEQKSVNAILVRISEGLGKQDRRVAMVVDALLGNREIVSKSVGPQVSSVTGISGASILADGNVVLLLDIPALLLDRTRRALITQAAGRAGQQAADADVRNLVMVVDDSITIRRVTERLLLKNGYRVTTAKDGLDAMAKLQTEHPAVVLLDIEMPRADGFEVATFIRNSDRIARLPIIMITSRSGDKHRERARQIGVNRYLIKPFQEEALLQEIATLLGNVTEGVH